MATLSVTLDETAGLQNDATSNVVGDLDDNDISVGSLPTEFQTALTAVVGTATPIGAALSGYDGTNANTTETNAFTFGANVLDVAFTDSAGDPLVGVDSGLTTLDGSKIYLYTATDNNVLLGRTGVLNDAGTPGVPGDDFYEADPNGALVFAAYLDTGTAAAGDAGATAAKVWLVQYEPLFNLLNPNPDDPVSPDDVINVTVSQRADIPSLEGAPSGSNLFLMFGTPGDGNANNGDEVAIIVTGKHPADQSSGANISTGDTVITSKGGGNTTIGTNNQMVDPGEGLYFTFVTDADPDYTVAKTEPRLTQTEANIEANIKFGDVFGATGATFDVVQLQPPKEATLKISAYTTEAETGVNFVNGLGDADDLLVAINYVKVTTFTKVGKTLVPTAYEFTADGTQAGISVDFVDGPAAGSNDITVTISGLEATDRIEYHTAGVHNRVLIDNVGNSSDANLNSAFDIGGFSLTNANTTTQAYNGLVFEDDGPTAAIALKAGATVGVDETAGVNAPDGSAPVDTLGQSTILATNLFTDTSVFGVDGEKSGGGKAYSLVILDPDSTALTDTQSGQAVNLVNNAGVIEGRTATSNLLVFTIAVSASTGDTTLTQYRAVVHNDPLDPDESGASAAKLADGSVALRVTVTDGDNDSQSAQTPLNGVFAFDDDGPTAAIGLKAGATVGVDETAGVNTPDGSAPAGTLGQSTILATNLFTDTSVFGSDGEKSGGGKAYSLVILDPDSTALTDTQSGQAVNLVINAGVIEGRTATSNLLVFTIAVSASTGDTTLTQYRAVVHDNPLDPDESGASAAKLADGSVALKVTVTDGDNDSQSAQTPLNGVFSFDDDGPSLAFGNLVGTGTVLPQIGYWTDAAGTDGLGAAGLDISLTGFQLVSPGGIPVNGTSSSLTESTPSPDGSGNFLFTGALTGDFDNNASTPDTTVDFSLTAFADGHYALDLVQGFGSTVTFSSADGSLPAGGPDPVQTLPIGDQSVVFFALDPTAAQAGIKSAILLGAPDRNEAYLQEHSSMLDSDGISSNGNQPGDGTFPFINDTYLVNVSTSGIGVGNNVFSGDNSEAITIADESFVVNPGALLTSMKVFIDNSVGGYSPASESLYYTIYYADGTAGTTTKVLAGDLTAESGGQKSFVVNSGVGSDKLIDAVQLTMAKGDIKIPVIEFTAGTENLASDVKLDFSATLTDGDGDTATDVFSADLYANELGNSAFDFILDGTGGEQDAFNIDLASTLNEYQLVTGFEVGTDKLVLIGDATAVPSINNGGTDSIVTITETGGQITTVTVVGVDLDISDVVFG